MLTNAEVAGFDLLLGIFDRAGQNLLVDRLVIGNAEGVHHVLDTFGAEQTHEVVLQRNVEAGFAGVALTAGTAAQLVVDSAGFMALGAEDIQTACRTNLFGCRVGLGLELAVQFLKLSADSQNLLVVSVGMAVCLVDHMVDVVVRNALVHLALLHTVLDLVTEILLNFIQRHGLSVAAEHDIGTTACHVGRNGNCARLAGLCNDLCLALVILCVQDGVLDALGLQDLAQFLRLFDGNRADQNRLTLCVALLNAGNGRHDLAAFVLVNRIRIVLTGYRLVGRDFNNVQLIGVAEFLFLGQRGTGHAGQLAVQTEVVLEGDGCQRLALVLDLYAFLGLDRLMQTLVVAAAEHQTAGKLINNDDLTVTDNVVYVALHNAACLDGLVNVVLQRGIRGVGQVFYLKVSLGALLTVRGQRRGLGLFIDDVIGIDVVLLLLGIHFLDAQAGELSGKAVSNLVQLRGLLALTGNDQRRTRLINQDGVNLIDDGERMVTLNHCIFVDRHVVAQVVETELIVRAVGDISGVHRLAGLRRNLVNDKTDLETEEAVYLAHPLTVSLGEVVVDGDNVYALAGQCVQISGKGSHKGLAFAGLHLCDTALMQDDTADDLYTVMTHTEYAPCCFTAGGKCLRQKLVERFAVLVALLEFVCLGAQLVVGQLFELLLECVHFIRNGVDLFQLVRRVRAENLGQKISHYFSSAFQKGAIAPFVTYTIVL